MSIYQKNLYIIIYDINQIDLITDKDFLIINYCNELYLDKIIQHKKI